MRIGLIGLGGMGRGLAKNMAAKGVDITVSDLDQARVDHAVGLGAKEGSTAAQMASDCNVLMICVTTAEAVQGIALGPDGALSHMSPGDVLVDHTTVSAEHVDLMRAQCDAVGVRYAEAPMTRTPAHADRGEVNILFGGDEDLIEHLRPVFETYAENIFHVGPAGHAIRLKLIHNYIAFANVATFCEGFALAAKEGLDMSKVIGIISAAGGKSGMMDLYGELTLLRDFTPHMSLSNAQKDVRYYAEWLEQAGLPGFMAQSVHQTYALASIMGHGDEGCTAVIKAYEDLTGVEAKLPEAQ
ncbi:NAD(P)-dependent oxidoreductase [Sulfitobacter mediterraneus]|jgi:3-hydroxyisobutyrate dehydrogenase-like beta-hydroxyacid dehydrogenase|uniref:NAD(P)-dependent oxidoreductase n=1 Tax=Sulfitobacter mediterraneus TaxID=83219 RepID=UPI00193215B2|nr:NAD(P)-dependent oxidoreductase [Sulfitobacter mediterraneus]MBM1633131.1 NAD(P)-dependent oxidoreductase [Sulfitobacter mediterraneus]MBM1640735.1 NAD(P)-dependent oxidoreductase [Sulfitobacter mediterraneus]MBM1644996.1 NAD(P)-dependent oxidoreductase [Sulfitobacter mediterraneus]MBM1648855.1 NAD(P)-dependent oxidoreductase [Sulfitobacter mediterraneus]MBM1652876.1 NAD(P)-dependent oxidoreductase [Sulfitobacter mediterraneus]